MANPDSDTPRPLSLPRALRERLEAWAREAHPHETCGLLVGRHEHDVTQVARITLARNLANERLADRYALDPEHFLAVDTVARGDGLEVVGVWHTHPDHPARPSAIDLAAAWESFSYLIVSVARDGVEGAAAWWLAGGAFVEQPIVEVRPWAR